MTDKECLIQDIHITEEEISDLEQHMYDLEVEENFDQNQFDELETEWEEKRRHLSVLQDELRTVEKSS